MEINRAHPRRLLQRVESSGLLSSNQDLIYPFVLDLFTGSDRRFERAIFFFSVFFFLWFIITNNSCNLLNVGVNVHSSATSAMTPCN